MFRTTMNRCLVTGHIKSFAICVALTLAAGSLLGQGLNTQASKDQWEEINFDFNSSVLVDGFPAMLQLSDLLQKNPGYKVRVEGNTDRVGSDAYNERLGLARANSVREYLIKNGANANQVTSASRGRANPRATGERGLEARTDEARWMNRRVVLIVTDAQGNTVSNTGAREALAAMQNAGAAADAATTQAAQAAAAQSTTAAQAAQAAQRAAEQLAAQNRQLQDQLTDLQKSQQAQNEALRQNQQGIQQAQQAARDAQAAAAANRPPTAEEIAKATNDEHQRRNPRFQILGMNVGATDTGDATFTGKGRYFAPFGNHYAFQGEGEYYYAKGRREGQADFGLVDRINRFQAGLFASFKHVNLTGDQTGGTLGQGSVTLDYLFKWGKIGAYGTKAFMDDAVVNSVSIASSGNLLLERYLRVVDQAGANVTGPLWRNNYFEGNLGYLRATTVGDRVGGTLRLIFPISEKIAFTAEGGVNETLIGRGNNGRAVVGVMFGNRIHPKEMMAMNHAVPVQVPRVRYEVLTRTVRIGNGAPVADAGPNQSLTAAATVTLNGSASYDPDGDPLTYLWTQEAGPTVTLNNSTSSIATFAAAAGQSYAFRLTVRDSSGGQSIARVTVGVATAPPAPPTIVSFTAAPTNILLAQQTVLSWSVTGADLVSISGIGNVQPTGSIAQTPLVTTTYVLSATRGTQTVTRSVTVNVTSVAPVITTFTATRASEIAGTPVTLHCSATNATSIDLNGATFSTNDVTIVVTPFVNTEYLCVANGPTGLTGQQKLTVNVVPGGLNP